MKNKTTLISNIIIGILMLLFIIIPFSSSDLHLKIYFCDSTIGQCQVFYATKESPNLSGEQTFTSDIDNQICDISIDKSLKGKLTTLRLDFPNTNALMEIEKIEFVSGGFAVKTYGAFDFFTGRNVLAVNDITSVDPFHEHAFIGVGNDPFFIMDTPILDKANKCFSSFTVSKALLCVFLVAVSFLMKKSNFSSGKKEEK